MNLGPRGAELIKSFEELHLTAYHGAADRAGVWTIGWGHTKDVREGMAITTAEAEDLFREDMAEAERAVNAAIQVATTQAQFSAMCSLGMNIGSAGVASSSVMRYHNKNLDFDACGAFFLWHYSDGIQRRGLIRRRAQEAALYCDDAWGETA